MKFSFEKAKDNTKKIIMGAGLITASFGGVEAKEAKLNINDTNNIEEIDEKQDSTNIDNDDDLRQQRKTADQKK